MRDRELSKTYNPTPETLNTRPCVVVSDMGGGGGGVTLLGSLF